MALSVSSLRMLYYLFMSLHHSKGGPSTVSETESEALLHRLNLTRKPHQGQVETEFPLLLFTQETAKRIWKYDLKIRLPCLVGRMICTVVDTLI